MKHGSNALHGPNALIDETLPVVVIAALNVWLLIQTFHHS